jgi:hypothetical protein
MPAAAQHSDVSTAFLSCNQAVDDGGIDKLGVLNIQGVPGSIDEASHQRACVGDAPQQTRLRIGMKRLALPIGVEAGGHLRHLCGIGRNDAIVVRFREIFQDQVEGGDQRSVIIDHDGFLMRDHEGRIGPLDRHARLL